MLVRMTTSLSPSVPKNSQHAYARLCAALGFKKLKPFFFERGGFIGWQTRQKTSRPELAAKLAGILGGNPVLLPGGPEQCERIGVVTGGAGAELKIAAKEGVDTFITGEGPHWTYALAEELGLNVFYGGHYATETFGVKALSEQLAKTEQTEEDPDEAADTTADAATTSGTSQADSSSANALAAALERLAERKREAMRANEAAAWWIRCPLWRAGCPIQR